jgi:glycosyltransferase involved in cell wall biosynthesis
MLAEITPIILCRNEEANIGRTLDGLIWAQRVIVLDSQSTDRTRQIAMSRANVEWHEREFDNHSNQSNHALGLAADDPWVLFMDADYVVTDALQAELSTLRASDDLVGYYNHFRYRIRGRLLRGALYPPRICLFRPSAGRFVQTGHTQVLKIDGPIGRLVEPMIHDDRKPESTFVARQSRYASLEARYLAETPLSALSWSQKVRRLLVVAPWLVPLYALLFRGAAFDGVPGVRYVWERAIAEALIARALFREYWIGARSE